ncbi:MAG: hypothetical protein IPL22_10470 [Bacteroidetes bacterium]|nr:hypothetical protein [Bacteroidota bacterium]
MTFSLITTMVAMRVADNYIEACVWGTTFNRSGNSFSYKPGLTAVTQPCEVYLNLIESGNTNTLPTTLNRVQHRIEVLHNGLTLVLISRLSLSPGSLGTSTLSYIIRPNPNQDIATGQYGHVE